MAKIKQTIKVNIVYGINPDPFYYNDLGFYLDIVYNEFRWSFIRLDDEGFDWNHGGSDVGYDESLRSYKFDKIELFKFEE